MSNKLDFSNLDEPIASVAPEQMESVLDASLSPEQEQGVLQEIEAQRKFGDSPIQTGLESGLSALTFGGSDQIVDKFGTDETKQGVRERRARNEGAALTGMVVGTIAPALLSGGTSALAQGASIGARTAARAGLATEQALAGAAKSFLKDSTNKSIARSLVTKVIPKAAGMAVETVPYSVGTLLSENALGNADLNAENLMATVGTGALLGAGLSGAGQLAGKGLTKIKNSALTKAVQGKFGKVFSPEEAAIDYSGFTSKQKDVALKYNPTLGADLVDHYKTKLKMSKLDSAEDIAFKNAQVRDQAGKEIGDIIDQLSANPNARISKEKMYYEIAESIDSKLVEPFRKNLDIKEFANLTKSARKLSDDFLTKATKPGALTARELQDMRIQFDKIAKHFNAGDITSQQEAARVTRTVLRNAIDGLAIGADPVLAKALKQANKTFEIASTLQKPLAKKIDAVTFGGVKDLLLGAASVGVGGLEGAVLGVGTKLLQSDFKKRFMILHSIEQANQKVAAKVSSSLNKFVSGAKSAYIPLASKIMAESNLTRKDDNEKLKKPATKQEAAANLRENVEKIISDPAYLERRISAKFYNLQQGAPETAVAALQITTKAINFLKEKMPSMGAGSNRIYGNVSSISGFELNKIARYVQAIEDPMSALEELQSGTLTRDHIEAIKAVYPRIYSDIVAKTMSLIETKPNLSYQKKIQLGILLDISTDETMDPSFILNRQAQYAQAPQEQEQGVVAPSQTGLSNLSFNNRYMSGSEEIDKSSKG